MTLKTSEIMQTKENFVNQVDEIFYKIENMDFSNSILKEVLWKISIEHHQYILNISKSFLKQDKKKGGYSE